MLLSGSLRERLNCEIEELLTSDEIDESMELVILEIVLLKELVVPQVWPMQRLRHANPRQELEIDCVDDSAVVGGRTVKDVKEADNVEDSGRAVEDVDDGLNGVLEVVVTIGLLVVMPKEVDWQFAPTQRLIHAGPRQETIWQDRDVCVEETNWPVGLEVRLGRVGRTEEAAVEVDVSEIASSLEMLKDVADDEDPDEDSDDCVNNVNMLEWELVAVGKEVV
ncbi:MAG: hypothetical protein Q9218_001134 [Villophora microphyllina]